MSDGTILYHGTDCADIVTFRAQSEFTADYALALTFAKERARLSGKPGYVYTVIGDVARIIQTVPYTVYEMDSYKVASLDGARVHCANTTIQAVAKEMV
jgi:hypothetical protein